MTTNKGLIFFMCAVCVVCFCGFTPVKNDVKEDGILLPVVMYHSISTGRSGDYVVPVSKFEEDVRELTEAGYRTISGAELLAYLDGKGSLPPKPVMIVFDDGHYNNILYGEPILKKYGARAIINVVGKFTDNTEIVMSKSHAPTYLAWEHIRNINRDVWEVGSHSYDMHKYRPRFGCGRKAGESDEEYRAALRADNDIMVQKLHMAGVDTCLFAFPFGKVTETAKQVLSGAGYKILFSCHEKVNILPAPNEGAPYIMLGRFNRRGAYSVATLMSKLEK